MSHHHSLLVSISKPPGKLASSYPESTAEGHGAECSPPEPVDAGPPPQDMGLPMLHEGHCRFLLSREKAP